MQSIFNEGPMLKENLYQHEKRLKSHLSKYLAESGSMLVTFYTIRENASTVDRGIQDIEKLFGHKSPLRFNKIKDFPVYGFGQITPTNTDEIGIEDINVEGDCIIGPGTIVPNPNDFFTINHLMARKNIAIFQVIEVQYDSMRPEGYYKIRYRLISTSEETLNDLENKVVDTLHTDLNAVGSNVNPIIREDDFVHRAKVEQMLNQMIHSYRALFYNERHNCFLIDDQELGGRIFDLCGNEFIAKHSLMNPVNSTKVVMLHNKLRDSRFPVFYNNSIYSWIELDAPKRLLRGFDFKLAHAASEYVDSSFARWGDDDIQVIQPLGMHQTGLNETSYTFFNAIQLSALEQNGIEPTSEFEKLIWKFVNKSDSLSIHDVSLYTADTLLASYKSIEVFLYTPLAIYIIRKILKLN
jgi:hypothetical protein